MWSFFGSNQNDDTFFRYDRYGGVQKVCTRNGTSLRRRFSCNTFVTTSKSRTQTFWTHPYGGQEEQKDPRKHLDKDVLSVCVDTFARRGEVSLLGVMTRTFLFQLRLAPSTTTVLDEKGARQRRTGGAVGEGGGGG